MLKGEVKKIYQREYMRKLRLKSRLLDPSVRPNGYDDNGNPIRYFYDDNTAYEEVDAGGNPVYGDE